MEIGEYINYYNGADTYGYPILYNVIYTTGSQFADWVCSELDLRYATRDLQKYVMNLERYVLHKLNDSHYFLYFFTSKAGIWWSF